MAQFMQENTHCNIIIVNIPPRHDIGNKSTTNLEIHAANMKLNKIAKACNNVTIVDSNLYRKYFTRRGLHINKYGKNWLSKQIATQIHRLIENDIKDTTMIPLKWKLEPISKQDLANLLLEQTVTRPINPTKLNGSVTAEKSTNTVLANPLLKQTVTRPINPTKLNGSVTAEKSTNTVLANPLLEQTVTCPIIPTKLSDSVNAEKSTNRIFNRNRRLPITRSDDFLC